MSSWALIRDSDDVESNNDASVSAISIQRQLILSREWKDIKRELREVQKLKRSTWNLRKEWEELSLEDSVK